MLLPYLAWTGRSKVHAWGPSLLASYSNYGLPWGRDKPWFLVSMWTPGGAELMKSSYFLVSPWCLASRSPQTYRTPGICDTGA